MNINPDKIYIRNDRAMYSQFLQEKNQRKDLEKRIDTLEKCVAEMAHQIAKLRTTTDSIGDGK